MLSHKGKSRGGPSVDLALPTRHKHNDVTALQCLLDCPVDMLGCSRIVSRYSTPRVFSDWSEPELCID